MSAGIGPGGVAVRTCPTLNRDVAIKTLPDGRLSEPALQGLGVEWRRPEEFAVASRTGLAPDPAGA